MGRWFTLRLDQRFEDHFASWFMKHSEVYLCGFCGCVWVWECLWFPSQSVILMWEAKLIKRLLQLTINCGGLAAREGRRNGSYFLIPLRLPPDSRLMNTASDSLFWWEMGRKNWFYRFFRSRSSCESGFEGEVESKLFIKLFMLSNQITIIDHNSPTKTTVILQN